MTLAVRLLGDRREAEEAVQDAFVKAFRSLDRFRGDASFGTWFYRILYNSCISRMRRLRSAPDLVELEGAEEQDSGAMAVDDAVGRADMQEILAQEMAGLPERSRAALTLFYVEEMKYEEIAAVMQLPMGTIKTHLFRGKQELRRRLEGRLRSEARVV